VIVLWFMVPVTGTVLISFISPMVVPRYLIVAVPGLVLLAAVGLTRLKPRWVAAALLVGILVMAGAGLRNMYRTPKQDWRGAQAYVEERARPDDGLVFYNGFMVHAYKLYEDRDETSVGLDVEYPDTQDREFSLADFMGAVEQDDVERERIWIISSYIGSDDEFHALQRALRSQFVEVGPPEHLYEIDIELYERK
jgi:hypothetical protein